MTKLTPSLRWLIEDSMGNPIPPPRAKTIPDPDNSPALGGQRDATDDSPMLGGERKLFAMVLKYLQSYAVRGNEIDAEFLSRVWALYDIEYTDGIGYFCDRKTHSLESVFDTHRNEFVPK